MKRIVLVLALIALFVLVACAPVAPTAGTVPSMPGSNGGGLPPGPPSPTTIVLPDGNECSWASQGAGMGIDGQRVNYTCSTENTVLIGDVITSTDTVWTMTLATISGTEAISTTQVTFQLNELDLVDGSTCLNAGQGATVGVDGQRLNWTCGDATDEGQFGVFGPLTVSSDVPGAYIANKILFTMGDSGATAKTTFAAPVTKIVGSDVQLPPGEAAASMPGSNGGGLPPGPPSPTTIVLPDGNECSWASQGAGMGIDGERVNYTCSTENTVLIGDVITTSDTVWTMTLATISGTEALTTTQVTFQLNELDLVDGKTCLNAGQGATAGVDGQRLNWTCGDPTDEGQYGVFGPLTVSSDVPGAYIANEILFTMGDAGATAKTTFAAPVTKIVGSDVQLPPGEAPAPMPGSNGGGLPPGPPSPTTIVLPDGNECSWASQGAGMGIDGQRVNYTCTTTNTVIIGDTKMDEDAVWTVTLATISGTEALTTTQVTFQLNELDLVDDSTCLNAGRGATVGIGGQRLNWTCGEATAEGQYGVFGPLTVSADVPGAYIANKILFAMDTSGPVSRTVFAVPVTKIVGADVQLTPGEIALSTESASATYLSPVGYSLAIPKSWTVNNYSTEELTGTAAAAVHPLAQTVTRFIYTPVDSTYSPFPVLTIYTFTADDWATVDTESGPPVGTEVTTSDGVVYVASTPQSNPYPEGTQDATNFNAMAADIGTVVASLYP